MNITINTEVADFTLASAILIYDGGENSVATLHSVRDGVIQEGHAMSQASLESIMAKLHKAKAELIPEHLLFRSAEKVIWWMPAHREKIWLKPENDTDKPLAAWNKKELFHPPLVFMLTPQGISVFALAKNVRPNATAVLYNAPYLNTWDDGKVCIGNVNLPNLENETKAIMEQCEKSFFDTVFTHTNRKHSELTKNRDGLDGLYLYLHRLNYRYELIRQNLVKTNKQLKDLL